MNSKIDPELDAITLVHSSDLHIDDETDSRKYTGLMGLHAVLSMAHALEAHAVLLAGDTFDNHRISTAKLREAADVLSGAKMPVVLLPGNHDPILPDCIFRRAGLDTLDNVFVFGIEGRDCVALPELDLEIVGFPHIGTADSRPVKVPRVRQLHWQVVMAHGHYVTAAEWQAQSHRSWLIADEHIAATGADYLALGHWDRAAQVGDGRVPAYYSGSPDWADTINLIRLHRRLGISISREKVAWDSASRDSHE